MTLLGKVTQSILSGVSYICLQLPRSRCNVPWTPSIALHSLIKQVHKIQVVDVCVLLTGIRSVGLTTAISASESADENSSSVKRQKSKW
jgi:hypothetical protein